MCTIKLHLSVTAGLYFLTSCDCPNQTGHYDSEVLKARSPRFFVLISGFEAICVLVYLSSNSYVDDPMDGRTKLAELFSRGEVAVPAYSVFVQHGYVEHGRCSWRGSHTLSYDTYLNFSSYDPRDMVVYPYKADVSVVTLRATDLYKKIRTERRRNQRK